MKHSELTHNFIFRKYICDLSIEETAELCFKSVRTVKEWDRGNSIPPECRRLMKLYKNRELSSETAWSVFSFRGQRLVLPTGTTVTPQQIVAGIALLDIGGEHEVRCLSKLLKFSRILSKLQR
ncbi:phage protein [Vibrio cholerae]|uniref:phage protein n=1 Tax=Vibrio cholerae TaxID=666 RepID=UPI000BA9BFDE|nr:phage protein [Vibrio cholerae]MCX9456692.1 phage protein [Vibrio cholerae]PAR83075.1 regulator [Vibrio cholerae]